MEYLEYLLLAYFLLTPIYVYFTFEKEKQKVLENPALKIKLYHSTLISLWLPTLFLIALYYLNVIDSANMNLFGEWNINSQITWGVCAIILIYFTISSGKIKADINQHKDMIEQFEPLEWLVPKTKKERNYFIFAISVSAGICEELLFRGYLFNFLTQHMSVWLAMVVSSIAFGLPHIYQGAVQMIKTAFLGMMLVTVYWYSDSLMIAILLHIAIDMYAGSVAYIVLNRNTEVQN